MRKNPHLANDRLLKSGLKIIGGKTGNKVDSPRKNIYALEPPNTKFYFEPFLGSGNVVIGKKQHEFERVGDINSFVIDFYRAMQSYPDLLFDEIQVLVDKIKTEDDWKGLRDDLNYYPNGLLKSNVSFVKRAAWYFIINKFSNNGIVRFNKSGRCNSSFCKELTGRGLYTKNWFDKVAERIIDIQFVNTAYEEILEDSNEQNPDNVWVFCDPPYIEVETKYDKIDFKAADHKRLSESLINVKGRWLLTINDHPLAWELYEGFNIVKTSVHYSCSNTSKGRKDKPELFIANYPIQSLMDVYTEQLNAEKEAKAARAKAKTKRSKSVKESQEVEVS